MRVEVYDKLNEACMNRCHFDTHFSREKMSKKIKRAKTQFLAIFGSKIAKNGHFGPLQGVDSRVLAGYRPCYMRQMLAFWSSFGATGGTFWALLGVFRGQK